MTSHPLLLLRTGTDVADGLFDDELEAAAHAYAAETFYHAWSALPEWAQEASRDAARIKLGRTAP